MMPSLDRRSKGLAARQAARERVRTTYVDLAAVEARRAELLAAALASAKDQRAGRSADVAAAWAPAIELVLSGMPVAEVAALLEVDQDRLDRLSRQPAGNRQGRRRKAASRRTAGSAADRQSATPAAADRQPALPAPADGRSGGRQADGRELDRLPGRHVAGRTE